MAGMRAPILLEETKMSEREPGFLKSTKERFRWGDLRLGAVLKTPPPALVDRLERYFLIVLYARLGLTVFFPEIVTIRDLYAPSTRPFGSKWTKTYVELFSQHN